MAELDRQSTALGTVEWDYAPAPEARDIVTLQERYGLFVGGELVDPRSGEWFATIDPSSEEPLAEVAQAGPQDVDLAVQAAREAFTNGWSSLRRGAGQVPVPGSHCLIQSAA
jgi:aldehyde dehydrogenase (NAD+)